MEKTQQWHGTHRGIGWLITNFNRSYDNKENWCHYVFINIESLPLDIRDRFWLTPKVTVKRNRNHVSYDYYGSIISNLEWHCGCTYYSKAHGFDGEDRIIKVGCDYQHYWDEGCSYDVNDVLSEVKLTINSLHALVPGIKLFCYAGYCEEAFHMESEGSYDDEGNYFRCNACLNRIKQESEVAK